MKTNILKLCLIFTLLMGQVGFAQNREVLGTITDEEGVPLPGVNITVEGTKRGTQTDFDGNYSINASSEETLVFSFVGFEEQSVQIGDNSTVNITMAESTSALDEVIVIGYGSQKKSDLTGSVSSVDASVIESNSPSNAQEVLQEVPGVNVTLTSGRPGGAPTVNIRGFTSITGSNDPLYVVDGVIINESDLANSTSPIDYLNPQDIESMNVLKDASATAIYGSRGANGVVVITTKQPKRNEIRYSSSFSIAELPKRLNLLNSKEFLGLEDIAYENAKKFGLQGAVENPVAKRNRRPDLFDSEGNPLYNTDWQKEGFRTAVSHKQHLSFSGGSQGTNYGGSIGYDDQQGIILASNSKKYSGRLFVNTEINDWLTAGGSLNYLISNQSDPQDFDNTGIVPSRQIIESLPITPVRYPDGTFGNNKDYPGMDGGDQPVKISEQMGTDFKTHNAIGSAFLKFQLAKNLEFKSTLGINSTTQETKYYAAPGLQWVSDHGDASITNNRSESWQFESQLTYNTEFANNHRLEALLAASWEKESNFNFSTSVSDFDTSFLKYNNLEAASTASIPISGRRQNTLNSYFGRINYTINDKYLFTFTGRFDGSSRFAKENRYGFFPSGAFAWRISQEDWLANNPTISDLKLRTSFGITGNSNIPDYRTVNGLGNSSYIFDGKLKSAVGIESLANADLKWEKDNEFNIGADIGLFSDKVSFAGDVYYRKSSNILLDAPVPASGGYTSVIRNIGSMENRGIELSITTRNITKPDFSWFTTLSLAMNRNEVLHIVGGQDILGSGKTIIREGESVNSFYGYNILGVYGTDQEGEAAKLGKLPGDLIFEDRNNDGAITSDDMIVIGNGLPKGQGSFVNTLQYKNWKLLINMQYKFGNDINWAARYSYIDRTGIANSLSEVLNAWTPDSQDTFIPQIRPNAGYDKPQEAKSTWIYDGSFIRAKRIMLNYNFPHNLLDRISIKNANVFVAVSNLFVITNYPGYDPEISSSSANFTTGVDWYSYPKDRTFQIGLNFSL